VNSKIAEQSEILAGLASLRPDLSERGLEPEVSYVKILSALEQFGECVRYLNTRRSRGATLNLENEADVQDAIYLMLRPWITDLVSENPTDKVGNRHAIKDFLAPAARTVIEAKFIRDQSHGKNVSKELHDDIEVYRHHPKCDHLIFFVYDPDSLIPDVMALRREMATNRLYDNRPLQCHLVVRP
jgi:hypothetical protein